ncbi:hypothetical protein PMZ80_010429 [Knufia obscura]|uniref:Pathway-specific nitrogen regulator n=2 Tax=Knufia TaxID=430999 RepID=A0AAN8I383_9EURO|nr:hypothetical protein PMZ80_010429 [Knufia obscura]KAK5948036.1 hypothetical protein OHC33_010964 [Knufia fluminis]
MSSLTAGDLQDDISIFEQSSPESLRARALSPHAHDQYSSTSDARTLTDDDYFSQYKPPKECTSSRSSISSFPASVVHHTPYTDNEDAGFRTPSRTQSYDRTSKTPSHGYLSAFRNPSSVRALQLESEYADSDALSLRNSPRPRRSPRVSQFSPRSPGSVHSSPTKRSSRSGTPLQHRQSSSKLKKEFPLVLLHCTLLPPAVTVSGPLVAAEILEAVLPEEYRKRWRTLQDKVVRNAEVKQRGVLIPHPGEDYDLLEERLLETLELERPRIRRGHYLGKEGGSDSGFESSSQNGSDEEQVAAETEDQEPGDKCPDCGKAVSCKVEQERRWEIKVFAANGLMRSGAWAAAWEEMEKVDVQVGVWMPEDVRTEVEERLKALQAKEEAAKPVDEPSETRKKSRRTRSTKLRHDERMKEIYGDISEPKTQAEIDGLVDEEREAPAKPTATTDALNSPAAEPQIPIDVDAPAVKHQHRPRPPQQEAFLPFMRRHVHLIWNDQKNLAIVLLSILVLFFSIQNAKVGGTSTSANVESTKPSIPIGVAHSSSTSTSAPADLYVASTVSVPPTALPTSDPVVDVEVAVPAEPEQQNEGSIILDTSPTPAVSLEHEQEDESTTIIEAFPTATAELVMDGSIVETSSAASEAQDSLEDELDAHTTGQEDRHPFTSAPNKVADDDHNDPMVSADQQDQTPVDFEPLEAPADDLKLEFQLVDDEKLSEDVTIMTLSSAILDENPASPSAAIDELDETQREQDSQAEIEVDHTARVEETPEQPKRAD